MKVQRHIVKVSFTTKMGVNVIRSVTLTDTFRSNAEARAVRVGVPQGATKVAVVR